MLKSTFLMALIATVALTAPVFAQQQPTPQPNRPAVASQPAQIPSVTLPAPIGKQIAIKTNLNTASESDLDKLPQIGPARAKAIIEARTKGKFKNWNDFVARNIIPANAEAAIKDLVTF